MTENEIREDFARRLLRRFADMRQGSEHDIIWELAARAVQMELVACNGQEAEEIEDQEA